MLAEERRSKTQELLAQRTMVSISELAEMFGASEMTIRRDLDELAARGICQRIHGGAVALRVMEYRNTIYPSFWQREHCQFKEKVAIGRAAAALVSAGDIIAIDAGTTAAYTARALRDSDPVTVVTNSIRVLDQLQDATQITLICPGGTLSVEDRNVSGGDLAFVGPITATTLRSLRLKKAFISTSGITVADGISNASLFQAEIKQILIDIAEEAILITDHTKFGQVHGFLVSAITAFSNIITDSLAPPAEVERLRDLGLEVILVEPAEDATILQSVVMSAFAGGQSDGNCQSAPPG
jgi:DeoR family fructose operon transcriptional repressor